MKSEFRNLAENGASEIVLTGIHLGAYGREIGTDLTTLVKSLLNQGFPTRIRLSSIEPMEIGDELVLLMLSEERMCPHLHIPLQSGDDEILKAMNRPYSTGDYRVLVEKLKKQIEGVCIGADLIIGFPGESNTSFDKTKQFLEEIPFDYLHLFSYSPRPKTEAAQMNGRPPSAEVKERMQILKTLNTERKSAFYASQIGRKLQMLVERKSEEWVLGHSENYLPLKFSQQKFRGIVEKGSLIDVLLTKVDKQNCICVPTATGDCI